MINLPDAPWIRDAERYGAPYIGQTEVAEDIEYSCPVCGADEPEDFAFDKDGDVIGCSCCCHFRDAYEYMAQKRADERVW